MTKWSLLFLLLWFLGTGVGTAFGILLVRAGATRPDVVPGDADRDTRHQAA